MPTTLMDLAVGVVLGFGVGASGGWRTSRSGSVAVGWSPEYIDEAWLPSGRTSLCLDPIDYRVTEYL
jgi:hypothetical protein